MLTVRARPSVRAWVWGALLVGAAATTGLAQSTQCSYDACALRLQSNLFSTQLVRGRDGIPVARIGMLQGRIEVLEQSADSVRAHYQAFRSAQSTGVILAGLGAALATAAMFVVMQGSGFASSRSEEATGAVLVLGGLALGIGGGIELRRATSRLQQAVWWYNRDLPKER